MKNAAVKAQVLVAMAGAAIGDEATRESASAGGAVLGGGGWQVGRLGDCEQGCYGSVKLRLLSASEARSSIAWRSIQ